MMIRLFVFTRMNVCLYKHQIYIEYLRILKGEY